MRNAERIDRELLLTQARLVGDSYRIMREAIDGEPATELGRRDAEFWAGR